jgi:hypothetical protein
MPLARKLAHVRALLCLGGLAVLVSTGSATLSPVELLSAALGAAHAQHSVHYVSTVAMSGVVLTTVGDAGREKGVQRMSYRDSTGQTGYATTLLVPGGAYVRGNAVMLRLYLGFSTAAASSYAGRWIAIPPTAHKFPIVAADVRLASALSELKMQQPLTLLATTTLSGRRVVGIKSTHPVHGQPGSTVLYFRATTPALPVVQVIEVASGQHSRVTFSHWNEPVRVTAPSGAVAIATIP